jgi:hypothetical protein
MRRELDDVHAIDLEHAKLSASGAHRWMHCTASAWMEQHFADTGSLYAEEGTRAHLMASECLEQAIDAHEWVEVQINNALMAWAMYAEDEPQERHIEAVRELYPVEMQDHVQDYLNFVRDRLEQLYEHKEQHYGIERRVNFSRWVPQGFGTADFWCWLREENVVEVIDYKHGKGVPVSVEDNEQALLYALGVWEMLHAFGIKPKLFRLTIFQPRISNVKTWEIDTKSLLRWADRVLAPVAKIVWHSLTNDTLDGVEFDPSDPELCRFCKAKINCRARADARLEMAKYAKDVALMTDDEVVAVLGEAEHLKKWATDLHNWAQERAAKGQRVKGWKLVEGRSNRRIIDIDKAAKLLRFEGFKAEQIFEPPKLLGLTKLEALVHGKKKLETLIGDVIDKPQGKPVLVPETDPRDEYTPDTSHVAAEFARDN